MEIRYERGVLQKENNTLELWYKGVVWNRLEQQTVTRILEELTIWDAEGNVISTEQRTGDISVSPNQIVHGLDGNLRIQLEPPPKGWNPKNLPHIEVQITQIDLQ